MLPDDPALYHHIVQCAKPPSTPRTMDGAVESVRSILAGLTVSAGNGKKIGWRTTRDGHWLYGTLNGGFAYTPGSFLRLYLNLRRSQYPLFMQHTLYELASAGVCAEAKVSLHRDRWDTYDGVTIYLLPGELAQVLDVLWRIDPSAYVRPNDLKPSRQVVWRGQSLPVFLAQEPDKANESFHSRLALALSAAMLQAFRVGSVYFTVRQGQGWWFYIKHAAPWEAAFSAACRDQGICPKNLYLNYAKTHVNLTVRRAIVDTFGSL